LVKPSLESVSSVQLIVSKGIARNNSRIIEALCFNVILVMRFKKT
jgi:hypothetical protein